MMPMIGRFCLSLLLAASLVPAAHSADFYEGKTISLVVGFAPGGMADADGRMIAQFLGRHIPGNPRMIVQNQPGAGGLNAINYAYTAARPDGLSIFQLASGHALQQLSGSEAIKFDVSRMPILGAWLRSTYVLSVRAESGFRSIADIKSAKQPPRIGTQGLGTGTYAYTVGWQRALGIAFQLVTGYEGNEQNLALERGEIDGRTDTAASMLQRPGDWLKRFPAVVQNGPDRSPDLPDVPTVYDLNPKPGVLFETVNNALSVDRPYVLSPGTPEDRVAILRQAWADMLKDPQLIAEAEKRRWRVVPTSYEKMEAFYRQAVRETPPDVLKQLKELFP
jgi:tripartite-type tricarboxylate transporter receptor subunit TctC